MLQAYLSNRPAVLRFQGVGIERTGLKIRQSGGIVRVQPDYGMDSGDE